MTTAWPCRNSVPTSSTWTTVPPWRVEGVGASTFPSQKPSGSAAPSAPKAPAPTARQPHSSSAGALSRRRRHIEALPEGRILRVAHQHFELAFLGRYEPKADDRIRTQGDIGVQMHHRRAVVTYIDGANEHGRGVEAGGLIHLHAVEIRMPDHELRFHGLARGERLHQPHLDMTDVLHCLLLVGTRRRRTSTGRLDEPRRRKQLVVARLGNRMHIGIGVNAHSQLERTRISLRPENKMTGQGSGVVVDDEIDALDRLVA